MPFRNATHRLGAGERGELEERERVLVATRVIEQIDFGEEPAKGAHLARLEHLAPVAIGPVARVIFLMEGDASTEQVLPEFDSVGAVANRFRSLGDVGLAHEQVVPDTTDK